jgi:hypothetical protein
MTVTLINAGDHFRELWNEARNDSSLALGWIWPGGHGRLFSDTIEELLVGAAVSQPTVIASPRQVTRGDLARLQVGLTQVKRDVFILNAERLMAWDAHLLNLCTTRAGVNLILLCEGEANPELAAWATATCTTLAPDEGLDFMRTRPTSLGRAHVWDCQGALPVGSGLQAACREHASAADCVLAWFPHAVITGRSSPAPIRARLHELTRTDPVNRWRIWMHARDTFHGTQHAAMEAGLPANIVKNACLDELSPDCLSITVDGDIHEVPDQPGRLLGQRRTILQTEGLPGTGRLFAVHQARTHRYAEQLPGDPAPPITGPPKRWRVAS